MFGARLYLISSLAVILAVVEAIPAPARFPPVLPTRNATSGQRGDNNTFTGNLTLPGGSNITIANNTAPTNDTGDNGARAACAKGFLNWCVFAPPPKRDLIDVDDVFERV